MTQLAQRIDGIPVVADSTTRDALYPAASRATGQRVHRLDANVIERWTGAAWTTDFLGAVATEAWTAPSFINSWADEGGGVAVGYRKDRDGTVRLRGAIKTGTSSTIAFVLPAGYRPSATMRFPAANSVAGVESVVIDSAGNVTVTRTATWTSLDGITFSAL